MKTKLILLVCMVLLVGSGGVLAFGYNAPYYKDNPLEMYPGQIREIDFNLQNCPWLGEECGGKDVNVAVVLTEGSEIVEITSGEVYNLLYGSSENPFTLKVSIPENKVKSNYNVRISLKSADAGEGGNVQLGYEYSIYFPVIIKDKSEILGTTDSVEIGDSNLILILVVIIILLAIAILIILIRFLNK